MTKPLSSSEYVRYDGDICPACKGEGWVETGLPEFDGGIVVYMNAACGYCGAWWQAWYELRGYLRLEAGR